MLKGEVRAVCGIPPAAADTVRSVVAAKAAGFVGPVQMLAVGVPSPSYKLPVMLATKLSGTCVQPEYCGTFAL